MACSPICTDDAPGLTSRCSSCRSNGSVTPGCPMMPAGVILPSAAPTRCRRRPTTPLAGRHQPRIAVLGARASLRGERQPILAPAARGWVDAGAFDVRARSRARALRDRPHEPVSARHEDRGRARRRRDCPRATDAGTEDRDVATARRGLRGRHALRNVFRARQRRRSRSEARGHPRREHIRRAEPERAQRQLPGILAQAGLVRATLPRPRPPLSVTSFGKPYGESGEVAATPSARRMTLSMQQRSPSAEARGAEK
jgi:hypothetical protein